MYTSHRLDQPGVTYGDEQVGGRVSDGELAPDTAFVAVLSNHAILN